MDKQPQQGATSKDKQRSVQRAAVFPVLTCYSPSCALPSNGFSMDSISFFANKINQNDKNRKRLMAKIMSLELTWTTPANGILRITGLCSLNQRTNQNSNRLTYVGGRRALAVRGGVISGVRCLDLAGQFL